MKYLSFPEIAKLASAAFAPFIGGIAPSLFGLNALNELQPMLPFEQIFKEKEYMRWQSLRQDDDTRFIGLAMPRILIREPYNLYGKRMEHRFFQEVIHSNEDYLWGNASFAYANMAVNAFKRSGWFAETRGINPRTLTGGVVHDTHRV